MKVQLRGFGSIEVEGREYDHDIVIDGWPDPETEEEALEAVPKRVRAHTTVGRRGTPLGRKPADHRHRGLRLAADHARGHQRRLGGGTWTSPPSPQKTHAT